MPRYSPNFVVCLAGSFFILTAGTQSGCTRLFGWDIRAPGVLSGQFAGQVQQTPHRIALYIPPDIASYISKDRGGRFADPQTYHVGEAFHLMVLEAFQEAFAEFILLEVPPSPEILQQYAIPYLVTVSIQDFGNRVTLRGQALQLMTEVQVYDAQLNRLGRFEASGTSDAEKVFARKGGPEMNLNAALERNLLATVEGVRDLLRDRSGANPVEASREI